MLLARRIYTREFKLKIVKEIRAGRQVSIIARERQIKAGVIYRWYQEYEKNPNYAFIGKGNTHSSEARIAELERMVGKLTMENELLKKVLEQTKGTAR